MASPVCAPDSFGSFGDRCNTERLGSMSTAQRCTCAVACHSSRPKLRFLLLVCQLTSKRHCRHQVGRSYCCHPQGTTISAQSTGNGLIGDGLTSPKERKAELKVGAIWLERAWREAPAFGRWQLRWRCIASHRIASQCSAVQCSAIHYGATGCDCGHGTRVA